MPKPKRDKKPVAGKPITPETPKIKSLILHCGRHEDQDVASVLLTHDSGFDSVKAALLSIREVIRDTVDVDTDPDSCCQKAYEKYGKSKFCPECGESLELEAGALEGDIELEFENHTRNSLNGSKLWEPLEEAGWSHHTESFDWEHHVEVADASVMISSSITDAPDAEWNRNQVIRFFDKAMAKKFKGMTG